MRSFIQYKAGATFYRDTKVTLAVRKNYIEYVFNLGLGQYGVINLMVMDNQLIFIADCGRFFYELPKIIRPSIPNDSQMPLLSSLLKGKDNEYFIGSAENESGKMLVSFAILHIEPNFFTDQLPISIASNPETIKEASRMLSFVRKLYREVQESDYSEMNQLIRTFEMV